MNQLQVRLDLVITIRGYGAGITTDAGHSGMDRLAPCDLHDKYREVTP